MSDYDMVQPPSRNEYWAAAEPDEIGAQLVERKERYYRFVRASGQLELWRTSIEKYFAGAQDLGKIRIDGQQDEQLRISVNHTRNVSQILLNNITQQKITFQPKASNTDSKSQSQSILAKGILEYEFKNKHIDTLAREIVDMTLGLGEAGSHLEWDRKLGDPYGVDPDTGEKVFSGGIRIEVLNPLDIVRDFTRVSTRDHQWMIVRRWRNKWDLAAAHPELADEIKNTPGRDPTDPYSPLINWFGQWNLTPSDQDEIALYDFYHLPSPALPNGRHVRFVNADVVLIDEDLQTKGIPVYMMQGGFHFGRTFGYTSIFDALAVQAGVDALYSSIATNNSMATQNILMPNGAGIQLKQSRSGMNIIKYDPKTGKPEPLQLVQTAPETYNFLKILEHNIELLSGVNAVARGAPEASLKSGAALALVQSQTIQFAQGLNASYVEFLDDLASMVIELYQHYADVEQTALIVGRSQRTFVKQFVKGDLDRIVRVTVDLGSPMASTLSGRVQMAQDLLQYKGITPEQYMMVIQDGRIENMTEGPTAELLNIRAENEKLADGQPVLGLLLDNHPLHIKEHHGLIASPEARENPAMVQATLAHIQEHVDLWQRADPNVLQALGLPPLPPPPPPPQPPPPPSPDSQAAWAATVAVASDPSNKDQLKAAEGVFKIAGPPQPAMGPVPPPPPPPPASPMPPAGPPAGRMGGDLAGLMGPSEGTPNVPNVGVRMPSQPKNPITGETIAPPVSSPVPPGVKPPKR